MKTFIASCLAAVALGTDYIYHGEVSSSYENTSLSCLGLKNKRDSAKQNGNLSKEAYYGIYWSDACQIRKYSGNNTCAGLHADAMQSRVATNIGGENEYREDMTVWANKRCKTLYPVEDEYLTGKSKSLYVAPTLNLGLIKSGVKYTYYPIQSDYENTSLTCAGLKNKRDSAKRHLNRSKEAYYGTYWSDACQIPAYPGNNECAALHADAQQSRVAVNLGGENEYREDMTAWMLKGVCKTLYPIEDDYLVGNSVSLYVYPTLNLSTAVTYTYYPITSDYENTSLTCAGLKNKRDSAA
jgi:hypothetical protein